jgi:hypothetical protein
MWLDLDISAGGTGDLADFNQKYRSIWMYDVAAPDSVFGMTKKPLVVDEKAITGYSISQAARVYDGQYMDSLYYWMENLGWGNDDATTPEDRSILLADEYYTLAPGEMRMEKYLKWGYPAAIAPGGDDPAWKTFLYLLLHQEGFYRGDVDQNGVLDINDVLYLKAYLASGPKPKEFIDQGDVNCDGNVDNADLVYLKAFLRKVGPGPAPIDKNRFLLNSPFVDPAHKALGTRDPGLFGDPDWKDLWGGVTPYLCGDANGDGKVNVTDVICLINYLFKGGPAPIDVSDVNLDGKVNVTDVIYLINWLFKGGPNPCD